MRAVWDMFFSWLPPMLLVAFVAMVALVVFILILKLIAFILDIIPFA